MKMRFKVLCGITAALAIGLAAQPGFCDVLQGFETDTAGWTAYPGTGDSSITRVASGTNGITSSSGSYHAEIFMDADVNATSTAHGGAYTYPGGTQTLLPGFTKATFSVDVYIDPADGEVGDQWNMQNAFNFYDVTSSTSGKPLGSNQLKTFSFICKKVDSGTWTLGRNSGTPLPISITTAGWYTMITEWTETPGGIVDYNWIDDGTTLYEVGPGVNVLGTTAASYSPRYMWLFGDETDSNDKTVAIDNASFTLAQTIPEPASVAIWMLLGMSAVGLVRGRRK